LSFNATSDDFICEPFGSNGQKCYKLQSVKKFIIDAFYQSIFYFAILILASCASV
jgi:hypothetical protein